MDPTDPKSRVLSLSLGIQVSFRQKTEIKAEIDTKTKKVLTSEMVSL